MCEWNNHYICLCDSGPSIFICFILQLELAGGIAPGIEDLWISCGSRKECQYTWDMVRNCNKELPGRFRPRCRFDRAYIRHSHPKRVVPVHFGLVGIEKVTSTQCFPSDHWGLHIHFKIEKP
jgi:tyrosyl-DNA phosphodiesterase 2